MATIEILLTSEDFIKKNSTISDNVAGKYIQSAIRTAQEIAFREVVGDALLARLKQLVADRVIDRPRNTAYKALVERAQYFLAYSAIVELIPMVTNKIANAGMVKTPDEKVVVLDQPDFELEVSRYQSKADSECQRLQQFLLDNYTLFPELGEPGRNRIQAHLRSAASCGIFLGGARGKYLPNPNKCEGIGQPTIVVPHGSFDASFDDSFEG